MRGSVVKRLRRESAVSFITHGVGLKPVGTFKNFFKFIKRQYNRGLV